MRVTAATEVSVERLRQTDIPALEIYLRENAEATVFHTWEWRQVIEATYGHRHDYWASWSDGRITGLFPAVTMRLPILGTKMVSMPYQYYSGLPLAASGEPGALSELIGRALAEASDAGADYLEIRSRGPAPFLEELGFSPMDSRLVTTTTPLDDLDFKQIRRNHQRSVKSAREHGVWITEGETLEELKMFRRLYLIEGRRLGAPQAGWNFFENLYRFARTRYRLLLAWSANVCLGGLLTLDDGRTVFARCGAYSSPTALNLRAGAALRWRAMSDAAQSGCSFFNHGVSWRGDAGLIHYKEGWQGTTCPVYLYIHPLRSKPSAPGNYFEGFSVAKSIWRRLPLPVVDWAGRIVTRWVC
jgi:hypothetical protein